MAAEGLICSANPNLNLSGGVGGAFLLRYGSEMQDYLHRYLKENNLRYIEPGHSVVTPSCNSSYTAIAHAVAINAFYETNPNLILRTYRTSLSQLAQLGCRSIVASCLGCGYGRCSPSEFATAIEHLIVESMEGVETVTFVTTNQELAEKIASVIRIK